MARVRYAVAGQPITHSLSPLLLALVHANLVKLDRTIGFRLASHSLHLVDTAAVEDALAWGYAGFTPTAPHWDLTDAPFGKFRTDALMEKAVALGCSIEESDPRLLPTDDSSVSSQVLTELKSTHFRKDVRLPTDFLEREVWMNFTSPLKHQLVSKAVVSIDESMELNSVNALRWDGKSWWCAGVDGLGVVALAHHHGVEANSGAVLGLAGGGGAARSTASAWRNAGGSVVLYQGRRELDSSYGDIEQHGVEAVDFAVDFDECPSLPQSFSKAALNLNPRYASMEGDVESRLQSLTKTPLDGRWMLVAQHLEAWQNLWAPHLKEYLPSLDLLLTQLVHAENLLSTYA